MNEQQPAIEIFTPDYALQVITGLKQLEWLGHSRYYHEWPTQILARKHDPDDEYAEYNIYSDRRFRDLNPITSPARIPAFKYYPGFGQKEQYTPLVMLQRRRYGIGGQSLRWVLHAYLNSETEYPLGHRLEPGIMDPRGENTQPFMQAVELPDPQTAWQFKVLLDRLLDLPGSGQLPSEDL